MTIKSIGNKIGLHCFIKPVSKVTGFRFMSTLVKNVLAKGKLVF